MSLILRQVLDHAVLRRAQPTVLSGHDHLDHAVRWVHTADLYDIAPLLRGDELLLTNGVGLIGVDETARRLYVRRIAESGVAALCFEVGRTFAEVPGEMVPVATGSMSIDTSVPPWFIWRSQKPMSSAEYP